MLRHLLMALFAALLVDRSVEAGLLAVADSTACWMPVAE